MEIIGISTVFVAFSAMWFLFVLYIARRTIGKNPGGVKLICCLTVMGPIGWSIMLIAFFYDLTDLLFRDNK